MKKTDSRAILLRCIIGSIIGITMFVIIYGVSPLNVKNDTWILSGYSEWDIQQDYAGWINYRNSSWNFPIAQADKMGFPAEKGVNIAFTDSVPLISAFFKLFDPVLPETFQWYGLYEITAFALQGIAAMLLLGYFAVSIIPSIVGTFFFISPILIERSFRHIALSSHYIILFALLLYFKYRKKGVYPWKSMAVLSILSVGTTPYFLPMVMIFVLALCVDNIISRYSWKKAAAFFSFNIVIGLLTAYCIGTIGNGYSAGREGYGYYSMNMNALINPVSQGKYLWSKILPKRMQLYGQYDGFNYIGVGVLALMITAVVLAIIDYKRNKSFAVNFFKRNITLFAVCAFLTVFAVSNVVCFDDVEILNIHLPAFVLNLCSIFRASSRLFYPVYYVVILASIILLQRFSLNYMGHSNQCRNVVWQKADIYVFVLALCLLIQCYDLSGIFEVKHNEMNAKNQLDMRIPDKLTNLKEYNCLFVSEQWGSRYQLIVAGYNDLLSNGIDTNTRSREHFKTDEFSASIHGELERGVLRKDTVYSTRDFAEYGCWRSAFDGAAEFVVWDMRQIPNTHILEESQVIYFMIPHTF